MGVYYSKGVKTRLGTVAQGRATFTDVSALTGKLSWHGAEGGRQRLREIEGWIWFIMRGLHIHLPVMFHEKAQKTPSSMEPHTSLESLVVAPFYRLGVMAEGVPLMS